jgi:hypothetical protein
METFIAIALSILAILGFIMICVVILFATLYHKSLFLQKLYTIMFERDDYKLYKEVKEYLKNNKMQLVPHTTFSIAHAYKDTLLDKYIFAAFYNKNENHEVALYDNNYVPRLTNFHNKLMQDLLNDAGYTQEDVDKAAIESNERQLQLEKELEEAHKKLEELEKQFSQLNK